MSKKPEKFEEELKKEEARIQKEKERLEVEAFNLEKTRYALKLKESLRKTLNILLEEGDDLSVQHAVLDQLVKVILDEFPRFEIPCMTSLPRGKFCFHDSTDWFEKDPKVRFYQGPKRKKLLLEKQLPVEGLVKIVFVTLLLDVADKVLRHESLGSIMSGGGIH